MSSPRLVNMMAYITNGSAFPKSLDPKGNRGNVSAESLLGYSKYTSRDDANTKDNIVIDGMPGGYYKYTNEREGATRTFTNEGWKSSKKEMKEFRNFVASIFQNKGKYAWLPIQSYKDYASASQYGLFKDEDYAQITKNSLIRFFKYVGLDPHNMVWWMNYHNNKNHPHVHVAFLEKTATRAKGTFSLEELKQYKRYVLTEMKQRERLILGTDYVFKNHMQDLQSDKTILKDLSRELVTSRQDEHINKLIERLYKNLPDTGRLQYGASLEWQHLYRQINNRMLLVF
ncbi:MAG: hypothetical protein GX760_05565 [Erysipelothrix sp.]|nr:hypothetical protein [Erysipelothrix sp.]